MHRHWRMRIRRGSTVVYVNTRREIPQIWLFVEDLVINLSEDTGVGAEGGRDVFVLGEEAYCPSEEAVEDFCVDQFPQARHVGGGEDEHVAELTRKGINMLFQNSRQRGYLRVGCAKDIGYHQPMPTNTIECLRTQNRRIDADFTGAAKLCWKVPECDLGWNPGVTEGGT